MKGAGLALFGPPSMTKRFSPMLRVAALLLAALVAVAHAFAAEDVKGPGEVRWSVPVLLVRDLDRSARWYETYLGFEHVSDRVDGDARSIILSRGLTLVHLRAQAAEITGSVDAGGKLNSRGRLILLVADVDALISELQGRDLAVIAMPQDDDDGRERTAAIADPDGNRILLKEPLPPGS